MSVKIRIPKHVEIEADNGEKVTFEFVKHFIERTLLRDKQFGASAEWLIAALEIRTAFRCSGNGVVELSDDQWTKLSAVTRNPSDPYNPLVMIEAKSFLDAILKPEAQ